MNTTEYKNNKRENERKPKQYRVVKNTDTETITHKHTEKPRLPKYDSQSETTNDSCLWLRTILGRNIEIPKS